MGTFPLLRAGLQQPNGVPLTGARSTFRYCGEYFDRETGTYYLRARNYNPFTGRFTTEDAVRSATVSLVGKSFVEPISLNLYLYCKHNPVNLRLDIGLINSF